MWSEKVGIRSGRTFRTSTTCYKIAVILLHYEAAILQLAACVGKGGLCHRAGVPPLSPGATLGAEGLERLALAVGQTVLAVFELDGAFAAGEHEPVPRAADAERHTRRQPTTAALLHDQAHHAYLALIERIRTLDGPHYVAEVLLTSGAACGVAVFGVVVEDHRGTLAVTYWLEDAFVPLVEIVVGVLLEPRTGQEAAC